jgi:hypothetical protein
MARLWFSARTRAGAPRLPPAQSALLQLRSEPASGRDLAARAFERLGRAGSAPAPGCDLDAVTTALERWLTLRNPFDRMAALGAGQHCWMEADFDQRSGMPWVIVSDQVRARLVPLHGARVGDRRSRPLTTPDALRRGIDWGTATLLVEPS